MQIAVTADVHLRSKQEYPERYSALANILAQLASQDIDMLLVAGVLFRLNLAERGARATVLVQSQTRPDWDRLTAVRDYLLHCEGPKAGDPQLLAGQQLAFQLRANPTVKRGGKRLGLLVESEQRTWLKRKLTAAGAELLGCQIRDGGLQHSRRKPAQTHLAVLFTGQLQVGDPILLLAAVRGGVGPAKGYGFGMLSLTPIG
jgi:CRISPR system Cascade subunit CasE